MEPYKSSVDVNLGFQILREIQSVQDYPGCSKIRIAEHPAESPLSFLWNEFGSFTSTMPLGLLGFVLGGCHVAE